MWVSAVTWLRRSAQVPPESSVSCFPLDVAVLEFSLLVKHVYLVSFTK